MDYAYLALNVYHNFKDDKLLGFRPQKISSIDHFQKAMQNHQGWFHLDFPRLRITSSFHNELDFYAELYIKVYKGKIHHIMVAFRGTCKMYDILENGRTWWNTVFPDGDDIKTSLPKYWDYAMSFLMNMNRVIKALDQHQLLSKYCDQHFTGHSLGGALANLVAARNVICQPAHIKSRITISPDVISFNAPGIGDFEHIDQSLYCQDRVISMRAKYDMISALGKGFGHMINNIVPEGLAGAKKAFSIEHMMEYKASKSNEEQLASLLPNGKEAVEALNEVTTLTHRLEQTMEVKSLYEQHSMDNFFKVVAKQNDCLAFNFINLQDWAKKHKEFSHDISAAPLFGSEGVAVAA